MAALSLPKGKKQALLTAEMSCSLERRPWPKMTLRASITSGYLPREEAVNGALTYRADVFKQGVKRRLGRAVDGGLDDVLLVAASLDSKLEP